MDNTNRYVNCLNGTVTDTVTGLIWLQQADCLPNANWAAANEAAAGLKDGDCGLTDGSSPGDWRLPTQDEWHATVARAYFMGCLGPDHGPSLTNDAGTGCQAGGFSSFAGVVSDTYWASFAPTGGDVLSWAAVFVSLDFGGIGTFSRVNTVRVWPVRSGPR